VKKNAGIEPRTVTTLALGSQRLYVHKPTRQDLIHTPKLRLQPTENPYFYCCRLCAGACAIAALIRQNLAPTSPLSAAQDAAASGLLPLQTFTFLNRTTTRFLNRASFS
jgi:hypothetical protein